MKCRLCDGRGRVVRAHLDRGAGELLAECRRCSGAGDVDSNRIASALEAWRLCMEYGCSELALAYLFAELTQPSQHGFVSHWTSDTGALLDEVLWAARGTVPVLGGYHGPAWRFGNRTAHAMRVARLPISRARLHRAWAAFWDEVLPSVAPLVRPH